MGDALKERLQAAHNAMVEPTEAHTAELSAASRASDARTKEYADADLMVEAAKAALAAAQADAEAARKAESLNAALAEMDGNASTIAAELDSAVAMMVAKAAELTAAIARARAAARLGGIETGSGPITGQLAFEISQHAVTAIRNGSKPNQPFTTATRMTRSVRDDIERRAN